ncbi:MAG: hypothetical protein HRT81_10695, partial [Henriciella sp.]|nr:hypothetical protein [Henriciella sp.]
MSAIIGRVEYSDRPFPTADFDAVLNILTALSPGHQISIANNFLGVGSSSQRLTSDPLPQIADVDRDGLIVVCDSILDKRSELGRRLGLSELETEAVCDAFLIRESYKKWGDDCPRYIEGDYAFACINKENRNIFLARDHIGTRPLYWSRRGQTFLFGSSIEALVAFDEFSWSIDRSIVAEFLTLPGAPLSKPFFSEIQCVEPGGTLSFGGDRVVESRWWTPSVKHIKRQTSAQDIIAECRHHLENSIAARIRSVRPVGSHFSAGIDSTTITVLAHRMLKSSGSGLAGAYAWAPPVSDDYPLSETHDERNLILNLSSQEGFDVCFGSANGNVLTEFLKRPIEFENETDLSDEMPVIQRAKSHGIGIMLSGWGGDEAYSSHGFGFLGHLVFSGRFKQAKRLAGVRYGSLRSLQNLTSLIWGELLRPLLPDPLYHFGNRKAAIRVPSCISNELAAEFPGMLWKRNSLVKIGIDPNRNMLRHLRMGHISRRMESWAALSAQNGFQYRYPLTDRRLLEFVLTLPPTDLYQNTEPRGLSRAVVSGIVPRDANKDDHVNEALRWNSIIDAWHIIKQDVQAGRLPEECS